MHTIKKTEPVKIKTPRPTAEERAAMLAMMKQEFDQVSKDEKLLEVEKSDRDFWNQFA
jgi:pyruvate/2-oxoglutarate dehydrogenase complex dihydrolipoamide acyltransferase (E2) component